MFSKLFPDLEVVDLEKKQQLIKTKINDAYKKEHHSNVRKVDQRNGLFIGRTRTGKSTLKKVLVDPTTISDEMTLAAQTRAATFESFIIDDNATVLNIIDTPGLFERGADQINLKDNQTILKTIEQCIARETTKFHLICFCASFESGINAEDVKAMTLLTEFLGPKVAENSCLIVTRCESKNEEKRKTLRREIENDTLFKPLTGYFKKGIFFAGSLDRDAWNNGTDNLYHQFATIIEYREILIQLLKNDVKPFAVSESNITAYRRSIEEQEKNDQAALMTADRRTVCSIM